MRIKKQEKCMNCIICGTSGYFELNNRLQNCPICCDPETMLDYNDTTITQKSIIGWENLFQYKRILKKIEEKCSRSAKKKISRILFTPFYLLPHSHTIRKPKCKSYTRSEYV